LLSTINLCEMMLVLDIHTTWNDH